jgi:hypothetical protein
MNKQEQTTVQNLILKKKISYKDCARMSGCDVLRFTKLITGEQLTSEDRIKDMIEDLKSYE